MEAHVHGLVVVGTRSVDPKLLKMSFAVSLDPPLYALIIEHCERKMVQSDGMFSKRTESNEIMLKLLLAAISLSDLE